MDTRRGYIGERTRPRASEGKTMEMKVSFPGNLRVDAEFEGFAVRTEQPVASGGDGSGPAPFDLFLASLATCAGIYMLSFMKQRGISSEGAGLTMRSIADSPGGMIRETRFELHLPPAFPAKYEKAVVRAVEQCTVKRHLYEPPAFTVTTSRAAPV